MANLPLRRFPEGILAAQEPPIENVFWESLFWDDYSQLSGSVSLGAIQAAGSFTFQPTFNLSGSVSLGAVTGAGTFTRTVPVFSLSGSGTLGAVTGSGAFTSGPPTFTVSGSAVLGAVQAAGTLTYTVPTFTISGAVATGAVTGSGALNFFIPVVVIERLALVENAVTRRDAFVSATATMAVIAQPRTSAFIDPTSTTISSNSTRTKIT